MNIGFDALYWVVFSSCNLLQSYCMVSIHQDGVDGISSAGMG